MTIRTARFELDVSFRAPAVFIRFGGLCEAYWSRELRAFDWRPPASQGRHG